MKPSIALTPVESGPRLRPTTAGDLEILVALLHDAQVRRYLCDDTLLPRDTVAAMLADSVELDMRGLGLWVIETADRRIAGIAGLQPASWDAVETEPIIALLPEHWGLGRASAALGALIVYARDALALPGLVAAVDRPNARSHRLLGRCGFVETGTTAGPAHELVLYALVFSDEEQPT